MRRRVLRANTLQLAQTLQAALVALQATIPRLLVRHHVPQLAQWDIIRRLELAHVQAALGDIIRVVHPLSPAA